MIEKNRSKGVTLFGISLLYFPIMAIVKFAKVYQYGLQNPQNKTLLFKYAYPSPVFAVLLFVGFIILAIGILKLKKIAYYILLGVASLGIFSILYKNATRFSYLFSSESHSTHVWPVFIEIIVSLLYFIAIVYFFTLPKVKEQFK